MPWQPLPLIFPDAELWATQYLRTALTARAETYATNVFVGMKVPSSRRDRMILIRRDGGTATGLTDSARLSLRVWATTEQDATDLARLALALLWAAPGRDPVVASVTHDSGPVSIPDESATPLRYAVVTVGLAAKQLEV